MRRRAAALAVLASLPLPLLGQSDEVGAQPDQLSRVIARLVDAQTGAPVTQALATLLGPDRRALSDSAGTVVFLDVPPGSYEIEISRIGYGDQTVAVEVGGMTSVILGVEMIPEAISMAPIDVQIEYRPRYLEEEGFYARRAQGVGHFYDPAFVDRWSVGMWATASRFVDLLKQMVPRFHTIPFLCSQPVTYVDGRRVTDDTDMGRSFTELDAMSTYMIGAVEVYTGSGGVPDFALDPEAACGVIAIWTNRWRGRIRELGGGDIELCQPSEPGTTTVEGMIRDEYTDVLLPGAHVMATWHPTGNTRSVRHAEIISDASARYRICDVPPDHTLTVKGVMASRSTEEFHVPIDGPLVHRDLVIRVAGPGDLVGRVVDRSTGRPVPAADIAVRGMTARTQTDELGYFTLADVLPGDHVVEIDHLGFEAVEELVSVVADRTVEVRVELSADPIALEPIVVSALRDRRLEMRGFYDRRTRGERLGSGTFLSEGDVLNRVAASTSSLLGDVPGVRVSCSGRSCQVAPSSSGSSCSELSIYLNGTLALGEGRGDLSIDELVRPSEISAVEVYPSATDVPAEFISGSGRCGAVAIWTR